MLLLPFLMASGEQILRKQEDVLWQRHFLAVLRSMSRHLQQFAFTLSCLPYEALVSIDAILLTIARMLVTRRHLLEWNTFSQHRFGQFFNYILPENVR